MLLQTIFLHFFYLISLVDLACIPNDEYNDYFNTDEDYTVTDRSDWMSHISEDVYLDELSIPGTHDSGTNWMQYPNADLNILLGPYWQTVAWGFPKQLEAGIRWFDIRLTGTSLDIYHGSGSYRRVSGSYWEYFLIDAAEFFDEHPDEVLFVLLSFSDCVSDYVDVYNNMNSEYEDSRGLVFFVEDRIPRLGEVRGQIVIQRNKAVCDLFEGMTWPEGDNAVFQNNLFYVQGVYQVDDTNAKWEYIENCLIHASNNDKYHKWHLNGIAWSQLNGHILPEYPCESCRDMNEMLYNALDSYSETSIGIMSLDFPGDPLIGKIIDLNDWMKAQCCFYTGTSYGGTEYCLSSSSNSLPTSMNNNIESWKCSSGLYPIFYDSANYNTLVYTGYCGEEVVSPSSSIKNLASSIKIVKCSNYSTYECDFYTDSEYTGTKITITNAAREQASLAQNDKISSFYCHPGSRAVLYENNNFAGNVYYTDDAERQSNLATVSGWNDKISSITVFAAHYCCFYVDINYQSDFFCISESMKRVPSFFNDKISSWTCTSLVSAKLWSDSNFSGNSSFYSSGRDVSSADSIVNDKTSSIEITIQY